jgi:hypothetical protein
VNRQESIAGTWTSKRIYSIRDRVEDMDRYHHQALAACTLLNL